MRKTREWDKCVIMNEWEEIAEGWEHWRQKPIKEIEELVDRWKSGRILDLGCGNGRNLLPFAKRGFECCGVDFSRRMILLSRRRFEKENLPAFFLVADASHLPFSSHSFHYCMAIAVLHHLRGEERRKCAEEIWRILKPGGEAFISVWNRLDKTFLFFPCDGFVPWKKRDKVVMRYYHFFTKWELEKILRNVGFEIIESPVLGLGRNLEFLVRKPELS